MSKKVSELAQELDMDVKELIERINNMGIVVKSRASSISDIDAKAVENMIIHSRKKETETKIVKAEDTTRTVTKVEEEPEIKISVKPVSVEVIKERERAQQRSRREQRARTKDNNQTQMAERTGISLPSGVPLKKAVTKSTVSSAVEDDKKKKIATTDKTEPEKDIKTTEILKTETPIKKSEGTVDIKQDAKPEEPKAPVKTEALKTDEKEMLSKVAVEQKPLKAEESAEKKQEEPKADVERKQTEQKAPIEKKPVEKKITAEKKPVETKITAEKKPAEQKVTTEKKSADTKPISDKKPAAPDEEKKVTTSKPKRTPMKPSRSKDSKDTDEVERDETIKKREKRPEQRRRKEKIDQVISMEKQPLKKPRKKKAVKIDEQVEETMLDLEPGTKMISVPITVKGLSEQLECSASDIVMALMQLGIMANINQNLDEDTVILLGEELKIPLVIKSVNEEEPEIGLEDFEDDEKDLKDRAPIITVMGHVDHGKTSLLDAIRKTNVTKQESGGITQHIGASEVRVDGQKIVFLDTPGHEAFTTMRARGAHITDIAVLVVAADDSVKPQTIESISHAKAAGVPIIVAINKTDKPEANPDRVMQDLASLPADQRVLVEDFGGETISVPVSAKTGDGIQNLLEMILLQAEMLELKANPNRLASGTVIEARLDKSRGPVATLLVMNGNMRVGTSLVAGMSSGKIRAMIDSNGNRINKAGPATAVEITGLNDVPVAGDEFYAVKDDKTAREIAEQRRLKQREEVMARTSNVSLDQLFSKIEEGEIKELNLVVKADVMGSVDALVQSLEKLQTDNLKVKIIHAAVGTVNESDVMLASTSSAIIIGFNVRPSSAVSAMAAFEEVEIRSYRIIYEILEDIEKALKGMLDPIYKEVILGKAEIRNTFNVPNVGKIGGAYVFEGKILRNAEVRLLRDGVVIHEGKISSLKRFKDDAREVLQNFECGIGIENFNDIKEGDVIEAFQMQEIKQ